MASMVVGGLFNAFAFAGAGYLFSKLNHNGYKDEIKRHNLALEHLSKAKQEWYEEEVSRKNRVEEKRHQCHKCFVESVRSSQQSDGEKKFGKRTKIR